MKVALLLIAALLGSATPAPKRVVYGWFPATMDPKANQDWSTEAIDWRALTHLSFRAVVLKPDGSIVPGWAKTAGSWLALTIPRKMFWPGFNIRPPRSCSTMTLRGMLRAGPATRMNSSTAEGICSG